MPCAVIGLRLLTPSHSCGRQDWAWGAGADVPVESAGRLVADLYDPLLAVLAADGDLPLPQVEVATLRVVSVRADPASSDSWTPVAWNTAMIAASRR